tara:strand:+ start:121 stop:678 length:558 start_codon:yes stop_codon:yes gene_type:complete
VASEFSSSNLIADRYASALYDLSSDLNVIDKVLSDLLALNELIQNSKDLKLLIKSPLISSVEKLKILNKLIEKNSSNNLTLNFLKVIEKNKRFINLPLIINKFQKINSEKRGDVIADITSAIELSNEQKNELQTNLQKTLGDKLSLNYIINKKIIGGLIVKVGSKMIDSSLSSKINKIKIAMKGA